MDASPLLAQVAKALQDHRLEVILIGNAAAALHGAPVTTIDIDFLFPKTPSNIKKLKAVADDLNAVILQPFYPASGLYRLARNEDGVQLDFMTVIDGVSSFESLRKRAAKIRFGDAEIFVAALADIIQSKKAAGSSRDLAVLEILEKTLDETARHQEGKTRGSEKGE
jgi:hypothetical protein